MDDFSDSNEWRARRAALQTFLREHHGAISSAELRELGLLPGAVARLCRDGWLVRVSRGVYAGAAGPSTLETTLRLGLLRAGPRSALTRRSAAHFLGLLRFAPRVPQVVVPGTSGFSWDPTLERHGGSNLTVDDLIISRGLRATAPHRIILDLAADAALSKDAERDGSNGVLRWALRSASNADPTVVDRLRHRLRAAPFPGSAVLTEQLGGDLARTGVIKSSVEDRFVELCKRYGIPIPETNVVVHGVELDAYWAEYGAYAELDTFDTHKGAVSFERDRADAGWLSRHQLRGFAITDTRIDNVPAAVAADVLGLLGLPIPPEWERDRV